VSYGSEQKVCTFCSPAFLAGTDVQPSHCPATASEAADAPPSASITGSPACPQPDAPTRDAGVQAVGGDHERVSFTRHLRGISTSSWECSVYWGGRHEGKVQSAKNILAGIWTLCLNRVGGCTRIVRAVECGAEWPLRCPEGARRRGTLGILALRRASGTGSPGSMGGQVIHRSDRDLDSSHILFTMSQAPGRRSARIARCHASGVVRMIVSLSSCWRSLTILSCHSSSCIGSERSDQRACPVSGIGACRIACPERSAAESNGDRHDR